MPPTMVKRDKLSRAELWCGDAVCFDDDGRCGCSECKLHFHTEMAAWAREQFKQQVVPAPCVMSQDAKTKGAKCQDAKRLSAKSKGTIKDAKGQDTNGKDKGNAYPRGFMPWNDVIKKVAKKTFMDYTSVK